MVNVRIICWFKNSETFISTVALKTGCAGDSKVAIRKVIDPYQSLTDPFGDIGTYDLYGFEENVNKMIDYIEQGDYDVEIIRC